MSFILVPKNGEDLKINAWNWRPTIELLRGASLICDTLWEQIGVNGGGGIIDANTAIQIADHLDRHLQSMKPGDRMRYDLTVTSVAKRPVVITSATKERDIDVAEAYSATYDWLIQFRDFCRSSGGFKVL